MKNSLKFISSAVIIFSFFSMCVSKPDEKFNFIDLSYDKNNRILLIKNLESAKYIKKIKLDLHQDSLIIRKVSKRLVPVSEKKREKMFAAKCVDKYIKLNSNVEYVKTGNTLRKLSEIDEFSQDEFQHCPIIVFP